MNGTEKTILKLSSISFWTSLYLSSLISSFKFCCLDIKELANIHFLALISALFVKYLIFFQINFSWIPFLFQKKFNSLVPDEGTQVCTSYHSKMQIALFILYAILKKKLEKKKFIHSYLVFTAPRTPKFSCMITHFLLVKTEQELSTHLF